MIYFNIICVIAIKSKMSNIMFNMMESSLISSVRRALSLTFKLGCPGFKSQSGTVGDRVTIIMWGARLG